MDERKAELKRLKKASKKARRRSVSPWKGFGVVFLVLAILLSAVSVLVKVPDSIMAKCPFAEVILVGKTAVYSAWELLVNQVYPGADGKIAFPEMTFFAITAALWVLFIICLILWTRGKKKWKKTEAYLNFRTMKNVLREEKKV